MKCRAVLADSGCAASTRHVTAGVSHQADGTGKSRGEDSLGSDPAEPLTAKSSLPGPGDGSHLCYLLPVHAVSSQVRSHAVAVYWYPSSLCCLIHCASARPNARSSECAWCDSICPRRMHTGVRSSHEQRRPPSRKQGRLSLRKGPIQATLRGVPSSLPGPDVSARQHAHGTVTESRRPERVSRRLRLYGDVTTGRSHG